MKFIRTVSLLLATLLIAMSLASCSKGVSKALSGAYCTYNAYRLYKDVKHHHLGYAAFQGLMAAHNCHQFFKKPF